MASEVNAMVNGRSRDIRESIEELGPWFHNLHLPGSIQTAPDHPLGDFPSFKWEQIASHIPRDLTGWTALDIGCNAGFYTFELAKRGARVTGIDVDIRYLDQARWASVQMGLQDRIAFRHQQVYDLAHTPEHYDLVLFMGVFYHLRYPLLGLDIVSAKVRRLMVFQTLTMPGDDIIQNTYDRGLHDRESMLESGWPKMAFVEHMFFGDPTNWWVANSACVEAMLRSSGMRIIGSPEPETRICEPDKEHPSSVSTWNAAEILSATGRPWRDASEG